MPLHLHAANHCDLLRDRTAGTAVSQVHRVHRVQAHSQMMAVNNERQWHDKPRRERAR